MDNNIFSKIAKQMNKYGDSFAKHSEKALQSAISSSEKLANKGKITIEIEKLNIELKKYYYDLGKYISSSNKGSSDFSNDEKFILLAKKIEKLKLLIIERKKVRQNQFKW